MFMHCLHTKFHVPRSNGPLVIAIRQKVKSNFPRSPCYFAFYKIISRTELVCIMKVYYHTPTQLQDAKLSGAPT